MTEWCFAQSNAAHGVCSTAQTCNPLIESEVFDIDSHGWHQLEFCNRVEWILTEGSYCRVRATQHMLNIFDKHYSLIFRLASTLLGRAFHPRDFIYENAWLYVWLFWLIKGIQGCCLPADPNPVNDYINMKEITTVV